MWSVTLSLVCTETRTRDTPGQAVYSHNRDGYGVQWCGREENGSEVWLHARGLCGWAAGCEVLLEQSAASTENKDKQSQRRRALGWRKAVALVGSLEMWRSLQGENPLMRFFWKRGGG